MANLRMNFEELHNKARTYRGESEEVNAMTGRLDNLMTSLLDEWEGQAAEAFNAQYDGIRPSILKLEELLNDISIQLDNIADKVEEQDLSIASVIGN